MRLEPVNEPLIRILIREAAVTFENAIDLFQEGCRHEAERGRDHPCSQGLPMMQKIHHASGELQDGRERPDSYYYHGAKPYGQAQG